jgi:hypothetical protein
MIRRKFKLVVGAAVAASFLAGTIALVSPAWAGPCRCPLLWGPVKCSNGKTYPNMCEADCHHATGCVPTGDL